MAYLIRTKNIPEGVRIEEGTVVDSKYSRRKSFIFEDGKEYRWLLDKPLCFNNGVMYVENDEDIDKALEMLRSHYRNAFFKYRKLCKSAEETLHTIIEVETERRVNHLL